MIFNRTQTDVDEAIRIRNEKVKTFQELTEEDITTLEKGTITINTLNRIETMQDSLKLALNEMGYFTTPIITKSWSYLDIFGDEDLNRIFNNAKILKEAFLAYKETPRQPKPLYYYENINNLEKILFDIDKMIDDVKSYYRECGTFGCGE